MPLTILDATTRAAVAAATDQTAQLEALAAPFVTAGAVTCRIYVGAVHAATLTHGAWSIDTGASPRTMALGTRNARTHIAAGTPTSAVFRAGSTDIFSLSAGVGSGDVSLAAALSADAAELLAVTVTAHSSLPLAAVPAWLPAVGSWANIAGSALSTSGAGWAGTNPGGSGGYQTVVSAWGGGCLNTVGIWRSGSFVAGKFLILFGGGHGDYAGNELYAFGPIDADAPTWSRILDPTIPAPVDVRRLGGYPVSRHTYDTLVYLPASNRMLCIGAPGYHNVGSAFNDVADLFDFDTDPAGGNPWSTADTGFPAYGNTIALHSGYDATTGDAWGIGVGNSTAIGKFDGAAWTSWAINNPDAASAGGKAACADGLSLMAMTSQVGVVVAVDLRTTPAVFNPTVTGSGPGGVCPLEWDATNNRFIGWAGSGNAVYFLTPGANPYSGGDAWAWSSVTPPAGDTPATTTPNGMYSRVRMVAGAGYRGLLLLPTATSNVSFYRVS